MKSGAELYEQRRPIGGAFWDELHPREREPWMLLAAAQARAEAAEARAVRAERRAQELQDSLDFQTDQLDPGSLANALLMTEAQRDRAVEALGWLRSDEAKLLLADALQVRRHRPADPNGPERAADLALAARLQQKLVAALDHTQDSGDPTFVASSKSRSNETAENLDEGGADSGEADG